MLLGQRHILALQRRDTVPRTFEIASLRGITIRVHLSAMIAFALLVLFLGSRTLPLILPGHLQITHWSVGFVSTLFLFLSTIAHELGHTAVARLRGIRAEAITLFLLGGSSDIPSENEEPLDEVLIAVAGPSVSLTLAGLAAGTRLLLPAQVQTEPLMLLLQGVQWLNIWLGAFNLMPTLPLDGGRALRGLLWYRLGDYRRATRVAGLTGQIVAAGLLAAGVALLIASLDTTHNPIPPILGYSPQWVAVLAILIAWFLNSSSRSAYRQLTLQGRFAGVKVSQLMTENPPSVEPWTRLDEIMAQHFIGQGERAVAVLRDQDLLMGLVAYADVNRVPRTEWPSRAAGEVMTPLGKLVTVSPSDNIEVAIRHMAEGHLNQLPVVADGRLVGMIARVNVLRFLDTGNDPSR